MKKYYACAIRQTSGLPDTAFLAGIAFAFQFSNEAMREHLCLDHQETLVRAAGKALDTIAPGDRRT